MMPQEYRYHLPQRRRTGHPLDPANLHGPLLTPICHSFPVTEHRGMVHQQVTARRRGECTTAITTVVAIKAMRNSMVQLDRRIRIWVIEISTMAAHGSEELVMTIESKGSGNI